MDTPRVTIWGTSTPRSFRPLWMAEELGIRYEHKPIGPRTGETQTPEYQQLN
ncbi:MAG: glutathione S-transferase family protein, partial [Pseudomonadota bacterium]|nr:glutathione S-transferase family protein [Pseudomonadota bacterium]